MGGKNKLREMRAVGGDLKNSGESCVDVAALQLYAKLLSAAQVKRGGTEKRIV